MDTNLFDDFDAQSQEVFSGLTFLSLEDITQKEAQQDPFATTRAAKTFDEISNDTALSTPFGKNSLFYKAKKGTARAYFESKNNYEQAKSKFGDLDLEEVLLSDQTFNNSPDLPYFCGKRRLKIVQYVFENNLTKYLEIFIDDSSKKLTTYLDNFTWFTEGEDSDLITFHLFADNRFIQKIVCTMGSDIFDCLKSTTDVNATGGFTVLNNNGQYVVNSVLDDFKKEISNWLRKSYSESNAFFQKFRLEKDMISNALDQEFIAEGDYQRSVDWIFEKMGVTGSFKDFVNELKDDSKTIQSYRIGEERYLPFHPNFDPIFNDSLLKAFGINPNTKIEDYFFDWDKGDIEKFKLVEKEVNEVYAFNAFFCGFWNALIDTADGFVSVIPHLYEVFTERAKLKAFLHLIKELFEHITEFFDKVDEWELKNSSYSVYRYEYFQTYGLVLILSLFLPMPKLGKAGNSGEAFNFFAQASRTFVESEIILTAYRLGLRIEKTSSEWRLFFYDTLLSSGSKEKIANRIGNIMEVAIKNPNIVFKLLPERKLSKLIDFKRGKGIKGLSKEKFLSVQRKLYNANIATAKFEVYYKGKKIVKELKAYSGSNISELDGLGFSKSPGMRSGEKIEDFIDFVDERPHGRFKDTESKIFREFEDTHLKQIMKELGARSTDELRIDVMLQTVLDPCAICQGQMSKFQKLYNAKIKIYSSGAKDGEKLIKLYPKTEVKRPLKK
jgi:hypothetical protein